MFIFQTKFSKRIFLCLTFVTILFIFIQLGIFSTISQRRILLTAIKAFFQASADSGIQPILFDPFLFDVWSKKKKYNLELKDTCSFSNVNTNFVIFAVSFDDLNGKLSTLSRLAHLGFTVAKFENSDQKLSHVFLGRHDTVIHLVVLHAFPDYWRQYMLSGSPHYESQIKQVLTKEAVQFLFYDRIYDKFDVENFIINEFNVTIPVNVTEFVKEAKESQFIPCNETRAAYFKLLYSNKQNEQEAKSFRHKAWKMLANAKMILDNMNIPFWLSSGTCLGYYRQCDFIEWTLDVDIGIFIEHYKPEIIDMFEKQGAKHIHKFGRVNDSFELSFAKGGVKLDIFFFYKEGASIWNGGVQVSSGQKFKYVFPYFTLCWTDFLKLKVRIPCQTEKYIVSNYGSSWFKPAEKWDWKYSPPNSYPNGKYSKDEMKEVIVIKG